MYCNFEYTGEQFNNKKIYRCKDCGIKLGLEDANIKILCFKQQKQLNDLTYQQFTQQKPDNREFPATMDMASFAQQELLKRSIEAEHKNDEQNLCSESEINARMAICNTCEHYKDNACMLCGCRIVRESNYQNKLAHRDASCPINKWGPISAAN